LSHVSCVGAVKERMVQADFRCLCQHPRNGATQGSEIPKCVRV